MAAAFSASFVARIAYDAGAISSTNSDSPGRAIEPILLRLMRKACCRSSMVTMREASTCGLIAWSGSAPSESSTASPATFT